MKRATIISGALAILIGLALRDLWRADSVITSVSGAAELGPGPVVVIDAGHGGEDGGAVSITGVAESGINLSIAKKLEQLLALYGACPVMLRSEDISLHDSDATTLRQKKVSDLHNRAEIVQALGDVTFVSIHQNTYPQSRYHGAQVFFAPSQGSQPLGTHIQAMLRQGVDPENKREAKPIPDSVYLMNHIDCPAVLVECGFLTNPEEEAKLRQEDHQRKLAAALAAALLTYDAHLQVPSGA